MSSHEAMNPPLVASSPPTSRQKPAMTRLPLPTRLKSRHGHLGNHDASSASNSRNTSPSRGPTNGAHHNGNLVLRTRAIKGRNLAPKDKHGTSDPYLVLTLGDARDSTVPIHKTLNPEWNEIIDLPIEGLQSLLLEVKCWDKDKFGKDYMGEFDVSLEDAFSSGIIASEPTWYKLQSKRKGRKSSQVSGEVLLEFSLHDPLHSSATPHQLQQRLLNLAASSHDIDDEDERIGDKLDTRDADDSDDEDDDDDQGGIEEDSPAAQDDSRKNETPEKRRRRLKLARIRKKAKQRAYEFSGLSDLAGVLYLEIEKITDLPPEQNMTRTSFDMDPFVVTSLGKKTYRTKVIRHNLNPVYNEKLVFQVLRHETQYSLSFTVIDRDKLSGNDMIGNVNFPIDKVASLAPEADSETGLYKIKDPESWGPPMSDSKKSRFRLPLSRSSSSNNLQKMNRPTISRSSSQMSVSSSHHRSDSMEHRVENSFRRTGSDLAQGDSDSQRTEISKLQTEGKSHRSASHPQRSDSNPQRTGTRSQRSSSDPKQPGSADRNSYTPAPENQTIANAEKMNGPDMTPDENDLKPFKVPIVLKNKERWEAKHQPVLHIRAKYLPYQALRQQFWRAMLKQYDSDDSGRLSKVELTTMLDSLGSTLRETTIDNLFKRFKDDNAGNDSELSLDQAVIALEELLHTFHERRKTWQEKTREAMAWNPRRQHDNDIESDPDIDPLDSEPSTDPNQSSPTTRFLKHDYHGSAGEEGDTFNANDLGDDKTEEHVVEIRECPICHQPRLTKKSDSDIITHIATCASQDWRQVNNIVMAGFVTSSQAGRKWYSKVITRIGYGGYKLGRNSANILVQDRITGLVNEERMSVYVRLGIRLLYKGLKHGGMERSKMRKLLRAMSYKQGRTYDNPASAAEIQSFINFHQLDMDEVLLSLEKFKTFNEFFYRKLKPEARPCSAPDRPQIITSPADCRTVVFNRIEEAQTVWIKGREFSVERLLGKAYPDDAKRYLGGSLGIFRLAPQDYHRFHIPIDGIMDEPKLIEGEYYTVNPMAIRSALDVYGENVRVVVPFNSVAHGRVMVICVGAMMVGSTVITRKAGERVHRAEELGYFKFGGSTILLLFEPGVMRFDPDLVDNSKNAIETLIRVGMSIGHSPSIAPYAPDMQKNEEDITPADRRAAHRRISGSFAPNMAGLQQL